MTGRFFSEGLRMMTGIALPSFIFGYFNLLSVGIAMSTGAICVSVTDSAGPAHHRANGMFFCILITAFTALITYVCLHSPVWLAFEIFIFGFVFSMLSVYNARVSSVGISALLIMILCMQTPLKGAAIYQHILYLIAGGGWYMCFSLSLYSIRPYKIIQQMSGEFISGVAGYLRSRASFYSSQPNYEETYRSLLQQQAQIQTQQTALSELLFKTRIVTKNSTKAARSLLKIYLDVSELFDSIMSVYQKYEVLHERFDETEILEIFRKQLLNLADELSEIAYAVAAGKPSMQQGINRENLLIHEKFEALRHNFLSDKNLPDFGGLGRIFNNIKNLTEKIDGLHYYTRYKKTGRKDEKAAIDLQRFNEAKTIDPSLFVSNLNFSSNIFRHSLRVAVSLLAAFLISLFFNVGHSYWILLTVVVILKPAYSLTKSRNTDRLGGTLAGILIGGLLLFVVKDQLSLLLIMVAFMAGGYMFVRTRYFISVLLMTVFLVIFFHIIYPAGIASVLKDRILDTVIGSAIAFASSLFFIPAWEHHNIGTLMRTLLLNDSERYRSLSQYFIEAGSPDRTAVRKSGQNALTALANVSDALSRMLSEPKRFQQKAETIYRFVVLNHILASHFAALSFYLSEGKEVYQSASLEDIADRTLQNFRVSAELLSETPPAAIIDAQSEISKHRETAHLLEKRKIEIAAGETETATKQQLIAAKSVTDQFNYIYSLSIDILKNVREFVIVPT